jgi:hypothetical protein
MDTHARSLAFITRSKNMPVVAIAATVASAAISANATNKATKAAEKAAADSNTLQKYIYDQNNANLSPYSTVGVTADNALAGLLSLGGDPAKAKSAFDNFLGSTGYQFQLDQGLKAISAQKATAGALNSGATLKALSTYGQNTALGYLSSYMGGLSDLASRGENAASSLASTGQNYANAVSQNNQSAAKATAEGAAANAKTVGDSLGSLSKLLTTGLSTLGAPRGQSSYPAQPHPWSDPSIMKV